MKKIIVGMFVLALIASPVFAGEGHECCAKAKKEGKTCEKCAKTCDKDKKEDKK